MTPRISEETFEYYVLDDLLAKLGYQILRGEDIKYLLKLRSMTII